MSFYYLDTSAALKLLVDEDHSDAFVAFYEAGAEAIWVSSVLLRVELTRALRRAAPELLDEAERLLPAFGYVPVDDVVVRAAAAEPDPVLRSLDAIHLASARLFADELAGLVTYDDRMSAAARAAGLSVLSPCEAAGPAAGIR